MLYFYLDDQMVLIKEVLLSTNAFTLDQYYWISYKYLACYNLSIQFYCLLFVYFYVVDCSCFYRYYFYEDNYSNILSSLSLFDFYIILFDFCYISYILAYSFYIILVFYYSYEIF